MSKDKKEKEMICGLTADERDMLQHELRALPDVMPPREVWHRIREQAEGIHYTVVNGDVLIDNGKHTGALPGQVLRNALYKNGKPF